MFFVYFHQIILLFSCLILFIFNYCATDKPWNFKHLWTFLSSFPMCWKASGTEFNLWLAQFTVYFILRSHQSRRQMQCDYGIFHDCNQSYIVSVCKILTNYSWKGYNLIFHSRFGTRFHFDEELAMQKKMHNITLRFAHSSFQ